MSGFGEKLVELRGAKTQIEVAGACAISQKALSSYEKERRNPRDEVKRRLAKYFGCSVADIFYQEDH